MPTLTRTLKVGSVGKDVEACKRAVYRHLNAGGSWDTFVRSAPLVRQTFGLFFRQSVKDAQKSFRLQQTGVIGPATYKALQTAKAFDAKANALLAEYEKSVQPKLVEPLQGFESLHESLWEAYSIGRRLGLTDLGTFNPESRLPSGGKSDHAVYPAFAFDLGVDPDTGYDNPAGREFFNEMTKRPEVEYVILGNRIWSRTSGLRWYTAGGHFNHVHVSGRR